jgi:hypothetical protein
VQHAGGDDLVGVVAPAQQRRDLQRMQDERRRVRLADLSAVARRSEVEGPPRHGQLVDEAREPAAARRRACSGHG